MEACVTAPDGKVVATGSYRVTASSNAQSVTSVSSRATFKQNDYLVVPHCTQFSMGVLTIPSLIQSYVDNMGASLESMINADRLRLDMLDDGRNTQIVWINDEINRVYAEFNTYKISNDTAVAGIMQDYIIKVGYNEAQALFRTALLSEIGAGYVTYAYAAESLYTKAQTDYAIAQKETFLQAHIDSNDAKYHQVLGVYIDSATGTAKSTKLEQLEASSITNTQDITSLGLDIYNLQQQTDGILETTSNTHDVVDASGNIILTAEPYATWKAADDLAGNMNVRLQHTGDTYIKFEIINGVKNYLGSWRFAKMGSGSCAADPQTDADCFGWVEIVDSIAIAAHTKALEAEALADGKAYTFYLDRAPMDSDSPSGALGAGDLWVNSSIDTETGNPRHVMYRYDGTQWVEIKDVRISQVQAAVTGLEYAITQGDGGAWAGASKFATITNPQGQKVITGWNILSTATGYSEMILQADVLKIYDSNTASTGLVPFSVSNGVVNIGQIDTSKRPPVYIGDYSTVNAPDPATRFENDFYKNTDDGNTYIIKLNPNRWSVWIEKGADANDAFTSFAFRLSLIGLVPLTPTGGSYSDPVPTGWSDSVPEIIPGYDVYMTKRKFTSSGVGQDAVWSAPKLAYTYSQDGVSFMVQYSTDAVNWHDTPNPGDQYMRTKSCTPDECASTPWSQAIQIKGEKGDPGDATMPLTADTKVIGGYTYVRAGSSSSWWQYSTYGTDWTTTAKAIHAYYGAVYAPKEGQTITVKRFAPDDTEYDTIQLTFKSGVWVYAKMIVHGDMIVNGTIAATHLAADAIDGKVINGVTINSGTVNVQDLVIVNDAKYHASPMWHAKLQFDSAASYAAQNGTTRVVVQTNMFPYNSNVTGDVLGMGGYRFRGIKPDGAMPISAQPIFTIEQYVNHARLAAVRVYIGSTLIYSQNTTYMPTLGYLPNVDIGYEETTLLANGTKYISKFFINGIKTDGDFTGNGNLRIEIDFTTTYDYGYNLVTVPVKLYGSTAKIPVFNF